MKEEETSLVHKADRNLMSLLGLPMHLDCPAQKHLLPSGRASAPAELSTMASRLRQPPESLPSLASRKLEPDSLPSVASLRHESPEHQNLGNQRFHARTQQTAFPGMPAAKCIPLILLAGLVSIAFGDRRNRDTPDFSRDIRPLFAENCFQCHGADKDRRKAGLRLDVSQGLFVQLESGRRAIVPGDSEHSELFRRITTRDEDLRMPPPESEKSISPREAGLIRRWIDGGARWKTHWAYRPVRRPPIPSVHRQQWPLNPIDSFILAKLQREGFVPSPPARKERWLRRVTFDLTGLPPTPQEMDAFLKDDSTDAHVRVVDRLLHSPRYGERMAVPWLDLARYADTNGYHVDNAREMWRWRDWVIDALNQNMPFDQFTVEQLAGDLLPHPTLDQLIATGFNRNHMINFENGIIDEEYRTEYVADRVITTATVWLGQTMQCARCHDHKYDPISTREFYQLFAYFNNVPEKGVAGKQGNAPPLIDAPTRLQQRELSRLHGQIVRLQQQMQQRIAESGGAQAEWENKLLAGRQELAVPPDDVQFHFAFDETQGNQARDSGPEKRSAGITGNPIWVPRKVGGALLFTGDVCVDAGPAANFETGESFTLAAWIYPTTPDEMTIVAKADDARRGFELAISKRQLVFRLASRWPGQSIAVVSEKPLDLSKWQHVIVTYDGSAKASGVSLYIDGSRTEFEVARDTLDGDFANDANLTIGRRTRETGFRGMIDDVRIYHRVLTLAEATILSGREPILAIVRTPVERRNQQQRHMLAKYYLEQHDQAYVTLNSQHDQLIRRRTKLEKQLPTTMVMQELPQPRATHVLVRGDYRGIGEQVSPGTPSCLPPLPQNAPQNRLALARWLVSPENPLTPRVVVNRLWQLHFGTGLVKTSEDFGTRGEFPSHPQLLDWLAGEFVRSGWDVKHIQRLILTSATYRQSSRTTAELNRRDPENRLLARGPRKPLPAEFVRDQAMLASGLLVQRLGGPSVHPYQPAGLWREVSYSPGEFSAQQFVQEHGEKLYRRGMYTFWKRSVPPPSLDAFGAPNREVCTVRRRPTNTPFHSLVLMNDPAYVEASRGLAERMIGQTDNDRKRIEFGFRSVVSRLPTEQEVAVLLRLLKQQESKYRVEKEEAEKLNGVGEHRTDPSLDAAEAASWTIVAATLINLQEALTY